MFRAYILAIFRELQVWCRTVESLAALFSVLKSSFFVELRVSLCNVKLCSLTESGVTMGAMYKRAAVTRYSCWKSLFSHYLWNTPVILKLRSLNEEDVHSSYCSP